MTDFLNSGDNITIRISAITRINWLVWFQDSPCVEVKGMFKTTYLFYVGLSDSKAIEKLAEITGKDITDNLSICDEYMERRREANRIDEIRRHHKQKLSTDEINELIANDEDLRD
jgi:benzoyl-CoA reductase/2-hydroxyglutaryl-CoA dehydratase subunit BcrC/BadD/HgdB